MHHPNSRRLVLGPLSEHTVFEAEVAGTILALDIIKPVANGIQRAAIALDNQSVIKAIHRLKRQPAQYLLLLFHKELAKLLNKFPHLKIRLEWVPGHCEIEGNEASDGQAKDGASVDSLLPTSVPKILRGNLPRSAAAAKAKAKKAISSQFSKHWKTSPHRHGVATSDPHLPSSRVLKLFGSLSRRSCCILTQLRTGHIGLSAYIARIGIAGSPICMTCHCPETVEHFLFSCLKYIAARHRLRSKIGTRRFNSLSDLSKPKHIPHVLVEGLALLRKTGACGRPFCIPTRSFPCSPSTFNFL